jgi:hypothetical protein
MLVVVAIVRDCCRQILVVDMANHESRSARIDFLVGLISLFNRWMTARRKVSAVITTLAISIILPTAVLCGPRPGKSH